MPFSAVLLDLDGTLLNTIPDLAEAVNAMLADLGRPALSQAAVASHVGKGTRHLVVRVLAESAHAPAAQPPLEHALALFRRHYRDSNGRRAALYPGVGEGLEALRLQGLALAVVTNKPAEFTEPLLSRCGLAPYFTHVVSGDTCPEQKPRPLPLLHACALLNVAPRHAVMIGDSINDVQAARAAGMAVLAVPYGYDQGQGVQNLGADAIVASIADAARWIASQSAQPGRPT